MLGGTEVSTLVWAILFLGVLAGGVMALGHYRQRNNFIWRALAVLLGGFVVALGALRYSMMTGAGMDTGYMLLTTITMTATTAAFVLFGYIGVLASQGWRTSRRDQQRRLNPQTETALTIRRRVRLPRRTLLAIATSGPAGVACYFSALGLDAAPGSTLVWTVLFLGVLAGGVLALSFYRERDRQIWRLLAVLLGGFIGLLGMLRYWPLALMGLTSLGPALIETCLFTATIAAFVFWGYLGLRVIQTSGSRDGQTRHRAAC